jgi:hypothetical protein
MERHADASRTRRGPRSSKCLQVAGTAVSPWLRRRVLESFGQKENGSTRFAGVDEPFWMASCPDDPVNR